MKTEFVLHSLIVALAFGLALPCRASGFDKGNIRTSYPVRGEFHVHCRDGRYRYQRCHGNYLSGGGFDYFVSQSSATADKVQLVNLGPGKHKVEKNFRFDAKKQKSKSRVNLWVSTLFQTPLLTYGENKITAAFIEKGKTVAADQFVVKVERAQVKTCRPSTYFGSAKDCDGAMDQLCDEYFADQNYCQ